MSFLVVSPVRGELAAFAKEDEPVRRVPVLSDVQAFVDLATQLLAGEVLAQEDGAQRFAEFGERPVGRCWTFDLVKRRRIDSASAVPVRIAVV